MVNAGDAIPIYVLSSVPSPWISTDTAPPPSLSRALARSQERGERPREAEISFLQAACPYLVLEERGRASRRGGGFLWLDAKGFVARIYMELYAYAHA